MTITIYSKPNCNQCTATYRAFDRKGIVYTPVDITKDQAAFEKVVAAGAQAAPFVEVVQENGDVVSWAGFQPEQIMALSL